MRILIVDDLEANRRLMQRLLTTLGHEAHAASSGTRALTMLAEEAFDLVFMDLQMPAMGGLETTRRIRSANGRVPIIALSGLSGEDAQQACRDAGMDGYLAKPMTIPDIVTVLAEHGG